MDWLAAIPGALNTAYNLYTNKRDFDYQKALQQTIFEREDTAVQRRMNDLQAAGLNPNLAAGSAAGAGSVVSRSSTNDVNMGSALDTLMAKNQIKAQTLQNDILDQEYKKAYWSNIQWQQDLVYQRAQQLAEFGFNPKITFGKDGKVHLEAEYRTNEFSDTPIGKVWDSNNNYIMNSNKYLEKELNWYTANQIADMLTGGIGSLTGIINAGASLKRANNMIRR